MGGAKEGVASSARTTPEMLKKSEEVSRGVKVLVKVGCDDCVGVAFLEKGWFLRLGWFG
jgi:hypothetical protein